MADEIKGREHLVRRQVALTAVFKRFAVVWPRAFAQSQWPVLLDVWHDALCGVDTDHLEPAAKQLTTEWRQSYPPKPFEFAQVARGLGKTSSAATTTGGPRRALRTWEWRSPVSGRYCQAMEFSDGWTHHGLDDAALFHALPPAEKVIHCEQHVQQYGLFSGSAA